MMTVLFTHMLMTPGGGLLPMSASAADRTSLLGLLLAIYPPGQFFGTPALSSLSDRFGRKPIFLACAAALAGSYLLVALSLSAGSLVLLGAALLICGLGDATVAIAETA